ncbi:FAD-binding protein [Bradyrhizobium yuanmingense]|nr:FAD-binding protein [Bradyrhizobium yuanmingense]MDF0582044.1 FAD-binding protein [Bradyrhizobium yuanmingense]
MMISSGEVRSFLNPFQSISSLKHVLRRVIRYARDRLSYSRGTEFSGGNALIARLLVSLRELDVEIWPSSPLLELIKEEGRVTGGIVKHAGSEVRVRASHGVILATGGFARNAQLRAERTTSA